MAKARLLCVTLLAAGLFAADRVPFAFLRLHRELSGRVAAFDRLVSAHWDGSRAPVIFSAELLTANSHRGMQLLTPQAKAGAELELTRSSDLGNQAVTIAVAFPILTESFHRWRGAPEDYERFLEFYRGIAASARKHGMKLIIETGIIFPGPYSAQSGFDVAGYYKTLSDEQFREAKSQFVGLVVRELAPDFVNLGAEPDTEAQITNKNITGSPSGFASLIDGYVRDARRKGAGKTRFGAGVGSWQRNGAEYVSALARTGVDYIDIHVYPVNGRMLDNLVALTEEAQSLGKPTAISEAWILKEGSGEYLRINAVNNPSIFARDAYSFWAPLDQQFLGALVKFAAWKHLLFLSPYWSTYFYSYVDYDDVRRLKPEEAQKKSQEAIVQALVTGKLSSTGEFWKCAVKFGPCLR